MKIKVILIIGNTLLALVWHAGFILGSIAGKDTDPAGRGYAMLVSIAVVVLAIYIPVIITFIITSVKYWAHIGGWYRFFLLLPAWLIAGFLLIASIYGIYVAISRFVRIKNKPCSKNNHPHQTYERQQ
jgi:hypothetical protein